MRTIPASSRSQIAFFACAVAHMPSNAAGFIEIARREGEPALLEAVGAFAALLPEEVLTRAAVRDIAQALRVGAPTNVARYLSIALDGALDCVAAYRGPRP